VQIPKEYEGGECDEPITGSSSSEPVTIDPNAIFIRIPGIASTNLGRNHINTPLVPPSTQPASSNLEDFDVTDEPRRTFCPLELREPIIGQMERHFCAHPLLPGYSHPSSAGIKSWAVKQMYTFCFENDLPEVWAYLWENWYRQGRWELWARAEDSQIPRLKTTMMVESQYVAFLTTVSYSN
jgi:hypothetical protein